MQQRGNEDIGNRNHEYLRHLSGENVLKNLEPTEDFKKLLICLLNQIKPGPQGGCRGMRFDDGYCVFGPAAGLLYVQRCVPYGPEPENISLFMCALNDANEQVVPARHEHHRNKYLAEARRGVQPERLCQHLASTEQRSQRQSENRRRSDPARYIQKVLLRAERAIYG